MSADYSTILNVYSDAKNNVPLITDWWMLWVNCGLLATAVAGLLSWRKQLREGEQIRRARELWASVFRFSDYISSVRNMKCPHYDLGKGRLKFNERVEYEMEPSKVLISLEELKCEVQRNLGELMAYIMPDNLKRTTVFYGEFLDQLKVHLLMFEELRKMANNEKYEEGVVKAGVSAGFKIDVYAMAMATAVEKIRVLLKPYLGLLTTPLWLRRLFKAPAKTS